MTPTVTFTDHAHLREYWVQDDQNKYSFLVPFDTTEEDVISMFNEMPAIIEEDARLKAEKALKIKEQEEEEEEATE